MNSNKKSQKHFENNIKSINKKIIIISVCLLFTIVICIFLLLFLNDSSKGVIILKTHANDIYEWKYDIKDKKIVKFVEKKRFGDLDDKNGGNITEKYTFKSLKPGKTTITFTSVNRYNKSFLDIKTYEAKVDKKLRLTITEVKPNS